MALKGKDLWEIVTGEETLDEDDPEDVRKKFKKKENQAHCLVCLGVIDPLQNSLHTWYDCVTRSRPSHSHH